MESIEPYRREVTAKIEAGWRIEEETADRVSLVKREYGGPGAHLVIALLTLWWTGGVGNVLYAAFKYFTGSKRTVVWKRRDEASGGIGEADEAGVEPI